MALLDPGGVELVSVASDGTQGDANSNEPSFSADGRFVAFESYASVLVPGDTNGWSDVFVHDRTTGETERVSVASDGIQGDNHSSRPSISADGRYVAFDSYAANLVAGDTNYVPGSRPNGADVFVHDRVTGEIERVSVASDGAQGDSDSFGPSISADGSRVAFVSLASNFAPGDVPGSSDVFVHDLTSGETDLASVASDGTLGDDHSVGPSISADGRYVAFSSGAANLVPGDTNVGHDVFVRDLTTNETERVSVASDGTQSISGSWGGVSISADGRYVAFASHAADLVPGTTSSWQEVFVHDRATGETERVSDASYGTQGDGQSRLPTISADGRYVVFESLATNLVPDDTNYVPDFILTGMDVFVHDRVTGETLRVSVTSEGAQSHTTQSNGAQGNNNSYAPSISADGRYVAYVSDATNLVPVDTNWMDDIFVHRRSESAYAFTGFFEPAQMGALNQVAAGRVIPLRFNIEGGYGLAAVAGVPTVKRIACQTGEPVSEIDNGETMTSGQSGFQYDAATGDYQYNWRTQRSWSGTCREVTLTLADGTNHSANFQFR